MIGTVFARPIAASPEPIKVRNTLNCRAAVADAKGDIQRGLDVVEFACGVPHLQKGEYTEGAGPGIDVYARQVFVRLSLRVLGSA